MAELRKSSLPKHQEILDDKRYIEIIGNPNLPINQKYDAMKQYTDNLEREAKQQEGMVCIGTNFNA